MFVMAGMKAISKSTCKSAFETAAAVAASSWLSQPVAGMDRLAKQLGAGCAMTLIAMPWWACGRIDGALEFSSECIRGHTIALQVLSSMQWRCWTGRCV